MTSNHHGRCACNIVTTSLNFSRSLALASCVGARERRIRLASFESKPQMLTRKSILESC